MREGKIIIDKDYQIGDVDPHLYSSFVEHMGRCVYSGIYQPDSVYSDEEGFRTDVIKLVRNLGVKMVRYPGGNFVSGFNWEDSIGHKEQRPRRLDVAWQSLETNQFGLHEFERWAKKVNVETMMAVNLGTRGIDAVRNLLEYCNFTGGTYYSELRKKNGSIEPFGIKTWCLGNEMDGPWQIGHKTAEEYGRLAHETGKVMKTIDPSIKLVACGSSNSDMPTFGKWEATVLNNCYDEVDYISLHQYYPNIEFHDENFLSCNITMDRFIHSVVSVCDYVKTLKRSKKIMYLSFDEWNVWNHHDCKERVGALWTEAPAIQEIPYDEVDALAVGGLFITLLRHSDRVKIACVAQLVNVLGQILTNKKGGAWAQTIYYPFMLTSKYGRGLSLSPIIRSETYGTLQYESVPYLDVAATYNVEEGEVVIFIENKDLINAMEVLIDLRSFGFCKLVEHIVLNCSNQRIPNEEAIQNLVPCNEKTSDIKSPVVLRPASWNVIRVVLEK